MSDDRRGKKCLSLPIVNKPKSPKSKPKTSPRKLDSLETFKLHKEPYIYNYVKNKSERKQKLEQITKLYSPKNQK